MVPWISSVHSIVNVFPYVYIHNDKQVVFSNRVLCIQNQPSRSQWIIQYSDTSEFHNIFHIDEHASFRIFNHIIEREVGYLAGFPESVDCNEDGPCRSLDWCNDLDDLKHGVCTDIVSPSLLTHR